MTLPMVTCPLCCRPGFSTSDSLCSALVDVTSRMLCCPICNHVVSGLDKFTIHLFSHSAHHKNSRNERIYTENNNLMTQSIIVKEENENSPVSTIPSPLLCLRSEKGQLFSLSPNEPINLKNITINTRNYITNTNITANAFSKEKPTDRTNSGSFECEEMTDNFESIHSIGGESLHSWPSTPSTNSENVTNNGSVEREFESCKELITKGDFSTGGDEIFEKTDGDQKHIMEVDKEEKVKSKTNDFACDLCTYTFPNKTILAMHKQLVHKRVGENEGNKRKLLPCNHCPRTFTLRSSLIIHNRVAHAGGFGNGDNLDSLNQPKSDHVCNVCGKFFKREAHLLQHLKVHDEKQWQCSICSKKFTTKYFLKKHRRLHTGEMPYTCKTCNKSFTFQQSYHKHLLYHTNEKPYCCSKCGRLFKELSTLHNHERIHSGEKPFTCETCGKAFRQRVSYLVHRRIHTGAMPYKCTACNKSFRYKISQRTHKCTAEPPGVVIRSEGYLVHRLQSALSKQTRMDAEKISVNQNVKSAEDQETMEKSSDSKEISKLSQNDTVVNEFPLLDKSETSSIEIENGLNVDSTDTEIKPQIYLIVKGISEGTYYEPVLIPSQQIVSLPVSLNKQTVVSHSLDSNQNSETPFTSCKSQMEVNEPAQNVQLEIASSQTPNISCLENVEPPMLSPVQLTSPSEKFSHLSLSPEKSAETSQQLDMEGFEHELNTFFTPDLTSMENDDNSDFFNSFTDDALKELFFGSPK